MKRKLLFFSFCIFSNFYLNAQTKKLWHLENVKEINIEENARELKIEEYKVFSLNLNEFQNQLKKAPLKTAFKKNNDVIVTLPNASGELEEFRIVESSVFEPELQAKFPEIRSYRGQSIKNPATIAAFSVSPYNGVSAIIRSGQSGKTIIIDPTEKGNTSTYKVFYKSSKKADGKFTCTTVDEANDLSQQLRQGVNLKNADDGKLRTFRLALSCTAEYSNYFGATNASQVANVNAAFNATMTRVNGVFEMDFNATMVIIANNNNVIYYNPATDPYSDAANMGNWNNQLQNTLTNVIGEANYDVGHLFGATGGGGDAGCIGCVCVNGSKGSGYTSPADGIPYGDNFDIDYVAHELGHQFGGNHTFTFSPEGTIAQKEPGSGSTIMGYAGITGATDVQAHSDALFHAVSIQQVTNNIKGKSCPTITNISNATPTANAGADLTLPKGTAFKLTGVGTDANPGDALTYIWEQFDDGTPTTTYPSTTKTSGPNFRTFTPTTSPTRNFPRLEDHLANGLNGNKWEIVPGVARTLTFRFTVRDNKPGGASNNSDDMTVTFSNTVGPFEITSQATTGITYVVGGSTPVTWNVNNTTSLSGSSNVNIKLSVDGGLTYPYILASNTLNDGNETITLPAGVSAPFCRILIEPTANVFYAINTKDFAIGYTVTQQCVTFSSGKLNATIVEHNPLAYDVFNLNIPQDVIIKDVNVMTDISHRPNQLYTRISHPDGTAVVLYNTPASKGGTTGKCGNQTSQLLATFDDAGQVFSCAIADVTTTTKIKPAGSLASFNGKHSNGTWKFRIADVDTMNPSSANSGTLNSFSIEICYQEIQSLDAQNFEFANFTLYPNPNRGNFTVKFNSESDKDIEVKVFDLRGRTILENTYPNNGFFNQEINLKNVTSGVYLVNINDGIKKTTKRILVE